MHVYPDFTYQPTVVDWAVLKGVTLQDNGQQEHNIKQVTLLKEATYVATLDPNYDGSPDYPMVTDPIIPWPVLKNAWTIEVYAVGDVVTTEVVHIKQM